MRWAVEGVVGGVPGRGDHFRPVSKTPSWSPIHGFERGCAASSGAESKLIGRAMARDMVNAVEPDLLKCLPYWAYKKISSGPLLSILSQYRERSGERAWSNGCQVVSCLAPKWSYRSYHWSGNISPLTEPFSLLPRCRKDPIEWAVAKAPPARILEGCPEMQGGVAWIKFS